MPEDRIPYRELLEHANDLIQATTPDGRFLYVNPAWRWAMGYEAGAVAGLRMFDLVHPDYRTECVRLFGQVAGGLRLTHFETTLVSSDGQLLSVEGSCSRFSEDPAGVLCVLQDVSDRRRAEAVATRQAVELLKFDALIKEKERELADSLEQARKYREAQERARELSRINEELKAEIERRRMAESQIRASLREKEVLLKEVHHRVKNNLQIISSLLNLQSEHIENPQALETIRESQSRVRSMALIHEKLYQSEDLAQIDFAEYIQSLVRHLYRSYVPQGKDIGLKIDVKDVLMGLDTAIPCGLIVNELVSNALKYAFPGSRDGRLYVALHTREPGRLTLVVGDTGVGLPEELDFRETESLGLQLVVALTDQLGGTIELDRRQGTEFRVVFQV